MDNYTKGIQLVHLAETHEKEQKYKEAYEAYYRGIELLLDALQNNRFPFSESQDKLRNKIDNYLTRAQKTKERMVAPTNKVSQPVATGCTTPKQTKKSGTSGKSKTPSRDSLLITKPATSPHYIVAEDPKTQLQSNMKRAAATTKNVYASPAAKRKPTPTPSGSQAKENTARLLKGVDPKMIDQVLNVVLDKSQAICWDDIAGLTDAKNALSEAVILPSIRPELFKGIRAPAKGMLLFGPPGTGKTMLAKALASEAGLTFFAISASALTSKYVGESEKMVKALFAVAKHLQPSIVFIDELDSMLTSRSTGEHEASRRLKTEFLVQWSDILPDDRVIILGATNRPWELDEAVKRRLGKQVYIPLPDYDTRHALIRSLLTSSGIAIAAKDVMKVATATEGYSGSDLKLLCAEAALEPIRELGLRIRDVPESAIRPVVTQDFIKAIKNIRPTVSKDSIGEYVKYAKEFGTGGI